jgi:hypothetical protein
MREQQKMSAHARDAKSPPTLKVNFCDSKGDVVRTISLTDPRAVYCQTYNAQETGLRAVPVVS